MEAISFREIQEEQLIRSRSGKGLTTLAIPYGMILALLYFFFKKEEKEKEKESQFLKILCLLGNKPYFINCCCLSM